jgi:hypothetical protein
MSKYFFTQKRFVVILLVLIPLALALTILHFEDGHIRSYALKYDSVKRINWNTTSNTTTKSSTFPFLNTGLSDNRSYYAPNYITGKSHSIDSSVLNSNNRTDPFGVVKLYHTANRGEEWFMNMNDPVHDPQFNPQVQLIKNEDSASWHVDDSKVRMNVYTSSGYDESKITTYDQQQLASRGYMQSPNDWKNIEMTGFVKYEEGNDDQNFAWYARGGKHTDSKDCEGSAYKGQLFYEGDSRFAKQQWFVSYAFTDEKKQITDPLEGKWIGFKFVVYNLPILKNGTVFVKMENWINENGDGKSWRKIDERVDKGNWGEHGDHCDGKPSQIISWGGPIATFRWDNADGVDIKDFSVREIEPPLSDIDMRL